MVLLVTYTVLLQIWLWGHLHIFCAIFFGQICVSAFPNGFLHLWFAATRHCFLPQARLGSVRVRSNERRRYQVWRKVELSSKLLQYRSNIVQYQIISWYQGKPESDPMRWGDIKFDEKLRYVQGWAISLKYLIYQIFRLFDNSLISWFGYSGDLGIFICSGILHKPPIKQLKEQIVCSDNWLRQNVSSFKPWLHSQIQTLTFSFLRINVNLPEKIMYVNSFFSKYVCRLLFWYFFVAGK